MMNNYIEKIVDFVYFSMVAFDDKVLSFFGTYISYFSAIDDSFFRGFFLTIGTSFLGVLAIVFSLSLFSIQYASENNTPRIFKRFLEDKKNKVIYLFIGIMAIILFLFALSPVKNDLLLVKLFLVFIFLITLLILLYYQYRNVAQSVNPLYIIDSLKRDTIQNLLVLEKRLNNNIDKLAKNNKIKGVKNRKEIKIAFLASEKDFFNNIWTNIQEIFDLTLKNSKKNNYDVTWQGFLAIFEIIKKYLFIRRGTFVDLSFFNILGNGGAQDFILVQTYEKIFAIQRIAISNKDLQLSKDLLRVLTLIAQETLDVTFFNKTHQSNSIFDLTFGYTFQLVKEGVNEGFYDLGIDVSDYYSGLSEKIISKNSNQSLVTISRNLSEIAIVGIVKKQSYLVNYPIGTIGKFIQDLSLSEQFDRATFNLVLKEAEKIMIYYVTYSGNVSGLDSNLDVQHSLGRFIDLTKPNSIGMTTTSICQTIVQEKKPKKKARLINNLMDMNDEIWLTFDHVLKASSKTNSFANYFISSNIGQICKSLVNLYERGNLSDEDQLRLLEDIRWYISEYWRMFKYKDSNFESLNLYDIEDELLFLGYKFLNLDLVEEAKNVNDVIFSIGNIIFEKEKEKEKDSYGFDAPRVIMTACKLAIYSKSCKKCKDISEDLIAKMVSDFYPKYIKKFGWQKDIFSNELLDLNPFDAKYNGLNINFKTRLISKMKEEDIRQFVADFESALALKKEKVEEKSNSSTTE